eukprot:942717-Prymnesium_polylepis.1
MARQHGKAIGARHALHSDALAQRALASVRAELEVEGQQHAAAAALAEHRLQVHANHSKELHTATALGTRLSACSSESASSRGESASAESSSRLPTYKSIVVLTRFKIMMSTIMYGL